MKIDLSKMCDLCYEQLEEEDDWYGFHVTDIYEVKRLFKGHKECVDIMAEMFRDVYGKDEEVDETEPRGV